MRSELCVYDIASGDVRVVLAMDGRAEAPNWDPRGRSFLINKDGGLFAVPMAAPRLVALPLGIEARCNNDHGYSPDGADILFSAHRGKGSEIFRMGRNGGDAVPVTKAAPSWWHGVAPDGDVIAYAAVRDGWPHVGLCAMDMVARREWVLVRGDAHADGPDFSPDGQTVFYNSEAGGHAQIWTVGVDGTGAAPLFADDQVNWFPHPSPCGRWLVYLAYPPGTTGHPADLPVALVLCRPDGSDRRRVVEMLGGQGTINVPSWAPDGSAFAFMRYGPLPG
jgi:Tol biopolymer transport system component